MICAPAALGDLPARFEQAHSKVHVHVIYVPEPAASKSGCSVPRIKAQHVQVIAQAIAQNALQRPTQRCLQH